MRVECSLSYTVLASTGLMTVCTKVKGHNSDTLLDELRDIIEHPDFGPASQERLDAGFAHLEEKVG